MSKAMRQQTYNFDALHDKLLADHFINAGAHLNDEVEVLGSAIRCILLTGDNLSNKEIILQLIHALEITQEPEACDVIRNTLEIVVGFTRDDV
ncbi:TPA: two-component-system connector protein AriR [Enterobacter cancerogenus]|jgi:Biofilm development protein YmgB/AriR.|uniref:biofilm development regulator YmgB/AriR family protein n=1 Tax=Enterobacter sp. TaxID=42895 RepID=UPI0032FDC163|nr:two-component-system connector protein AriR [Enterobacter cancerogenus]HDR2164430.1 two-component-system connector protein AriR [Enterobacter cancerogenus]HDR2267356.1 two-component-system connector protein AriR [Enterobacter cancerogenus]